MKQSLASNEDVLPHTAIFLFPLLIINTSITLNTSDIDGIPTIASNWIKALVFNLVYVDVFYCYYGIKNTIDSSSWTATKIKMWSRHHCVSDDTNRFRRSLKNNQLDVQFFCFIIRLLQSSTCFEQCCAHHQGSNCIKTGSGIVTLCKWPSGAPEGHLLRPAYQTVIYTEWQIAGIA